MTIAIVFGTFAPMHLGHMDVIKAAAEENDRVIVVCCGHEGDRGYPKLPLEMRYRYAKEAVRDITGYVLCFPDTDPDVKADWTAEQIWYYWLEKMKITMTEERMIDYFNDELIWYTAEPDYIRLITASGHKVRQLERVRNISATFIRNDPGAYADAVIPPFDEAFKEDLR